MLLLIIKTFHKEQRNGINFAYNEGVEIKWGRVVEFFGKFVNKMKWGSKFSKNCKATPQLSTTEYHLPSPSEYWYLFLRKILILKN